MERVPALVLAGRRRGEDPFAEREGAAHRALIPAGGVPMLLRVVRALRACERIGAIAVSIDAPELLDSVPELRDAVADGSLRVYESLDSPSRSARDALERFAPDFRALVTTADHALLSPRIVDAFLTRADARGPDVAVGVVAEARIRDAHPGATRTYLRFREGGYSGANLFALRGPAAQRAVGFWVSAEQFRKRPWRLAAVFGPASLVLFAARRLTLHDALVRASRAIGCAVAAVELPFAEAAIDVDRPSDLALVESILAARA